ncbi:hypothetical protein EIMP300_76570 [Escherichia coli]|uniref:Transmembrane protein n=1 Tax=Escherichia coli TaxID=562 RepID=A0A8S0G2E0_ECOLX|nr:hypothetical protein EIMP300_76570 [Escherichia coli]
MNSSSTQQIKYELFIVQLFYKSFLMRIFIYYVTHDLQADGRCEKINIKTMSDRSCGMCITSNVLVIFISFEIFNIISCEIVLLCI